MKRLYLIRHGQCGRQRHRCIGSTELRLCEEGVQQGERLRLWAGGCALSAVYTSPLIRCKETACILSGGRFPIYVMDELREMDCGAWEGLSFHEIRVRWPEVYALRGEHPGCVPPPGGESLLQAGGRLEHCARRIAAEARGNCALVAHGGVIRGWLVRLLHMDPDQVLSIPQPWGGVTELGWDGGEFIPISVGVLPEGGPQ